jgi:hypothetical protein
MYLFFFLINHHCGCPILAPLQRLRPGGYWRRKGGTEGRMNNRFFVSSCPSGDLLHDKDTGRTSSSMVAHTFLRSTLAARFYCLSSFPASGKSGAPTTTVDKGKEDIT